MADEAQKIARSNDSNNVLAKYDGDIELKKAIAQYTYNACSIAFREGAFHDRNWMASSSRKGLLKAWTDEEIYEMGLNYE